MLQKNDGELFQCRLDAKSSPKMLYFLFHWLVIALAVFMTPHLISGVHSEGFGSALAVAAILGLLNVVLKPILFVLTLPFTLITLGFFILILNAFLFQLAASFVSGFQVDSFGAAFLASLVVSLVSWAMNLSARRHNGRIVWQVRQTSHSRQDRMRDLN